MCYKEVEPRNLTLVEKRSFNRCWKGGVGKRVETEVREGGEVRVSVDRDGKHGILEPTLWRVEGAARVRQAEEQQQQHE